MILDARGGLRGLLIDLNGGRVIRKAFWADTDTGEYEAFLEGPGGLVLRDPEGRPLTYRGRARLKFVPAVPLPAPKPSDPRDLAGALEEARRQYAKPIPAVPGRQCMEPRCLRMATWEVGDAREVEPEVTADGRACTRAVTTRVTRWCSWHYRAPTWTSLRGVESEIEVATRPQ
jgi:hypothetical protein